MTPTSPLPLVARLFNCDIEEKSLLNESTLSAAALGGAVVADGADVPGLTVVAVVDLLDEEHAAPARLRVTAIDKPPTALSLLFLTPSLLCR